MTALRRRVRDGAVVLRTGRSLVQVGWSLRRGGFPRAVALMSLRATPGPVRAHRPAPAPPVARDIRVAVRVTRLLGSRVTCLHKALALVPELVRADVPPTVVLGVLGVLDAQEFAAHAWLETPYGRLDPNRLDLSDYGVIGRFTPAVGP